MPDDPKDVIREIYIDPNYDSYKDYMDSRMVKAISDSAPVNSALCKHVYDLFLELRGVSYNASMPYIAAQSVAGFHNGYLGTDNPRTIFLRHASAITERLRSEVPCLVKNQRLAKKIDDKLKSYVRDYAGIESTVKIAIEGNEIWNNFISIRPFAYGVWSSQRVSYLSAFSAYDNFMARITKDALGIPECRTTNSRFDADLKDAFGDDVAKLSWTENPLLTYRDIRHSLAHAGGQMTSRLKGRGYKCHVIDTVIQITPKELKELYSAIMQSIDGIVKVGLTIDKLVRSVN